MTFDELLSRPLALIPQQDDPSPAAFTSVYEQGDVWVKIRGCEDCPPEVLAKCCGNCPLASSAGCLLHLLNKRTSQKPYNCVVKPTPEKTLSYCVQEFQCVRGTYEGRIRRVRDKRGELI